jgi:hypothetical protein
MTTGRPPGNPDFTPGHKKIGGRLRGTPNKRTTARREVLDRAAAVVMPQLPDEIRDITPLEGLLLCLRWSIAAQDREGILAAAVAAAPYCHPKLSTTDVRFTNPHERLSDEELEAAIAELERKIAATKPIR